METNNTSTSDDALALESFKKIILGKNSQHIRDVVEEDARELVSKVLTEALHDREKADGTVSQILTPVVEMAVEKSVTDNKDLFIGYLYPLVGGLVRKSVSSFLASLVEQTNQLLESSFTIKGIYWRFKAWQAGLSYSQYVIKQNFSFRVEQILLIHTETSMLLNTVIKDKTQATDGDMVSAMLSAINDFVGDSFEQENTDKQSLDEIKTDDFTLLIKQGPQAMLVAAITGNPPADIGEKLQLNLETIHKIYGAELHDFDGDSQAFANTDQQLNKCLVERQKQSEVTGKKRPWLAMILLLVFAIVCGYFFSKQWLLDSKIQQINALDSVPGIVLLDTHACSENICIELMRDPLAEPALSWLKKANLADTDIDIIEHTYRSADTKLIGNIQLSKIKSLTSAPGIILLDAFICEEKICIELLRDPIAESALLWLKKANLAGTELVVSERAYRSLDENLIDMRLYLLIKGYPGLSYANGVFQGQLKQSVLTKFKRVVSALPDKLDLTLLFSKLEIIPRTLSSDYKINRALLDQSITKLQNTTIIFDEGESHLRPFSIKKLKLVSENITEILDLAELLDYNIEIIVMGASSSTGNKAFNEQLSRKRAASVRKNLIKNKLNKDIVQAIGLGSINEKARRVMFSVVKLTAQNSDLDVDIMAPIR